MAAETSTTRTEGPLPMVRDIFAGARGLDRAEWGRVWLAVQGVVGFLVLAALLLFTDSEAAKAADAEEGDVLIWAPLAVAGILLVLAFLSRRTAWTSRSYVAGLTMLLLYPLLVVQVNPYVYIPSAAGFVVWGLISLHPVERTFLAFIAWFPLLGFAYAFSFSDQNMLVAGTLLVLQMLFLWALLPTEGPWRIVPYSVAMALFLVVGLSLLAGALAYQSWTALMAGTATLALMPVLTMLLHRLRDHTLASPVNLPSATMGDGETP